MAIKFEETKELQITLFDDDNHSSFFKIPNPIEGIESDTTLTSAITDILLGDPEGQASDNMFAVDGQYQPTKIKMEKIITQKTTFIDQTAE